MLNFDSDGDVDANVNANVKCEHTFMVYLHCRIGYIDIDSDSDYKLNSYIVLCRTFFAVQS